MGAALKLACRHCGAVRWVRARRLCSACYDRPAVRELYPSRRSRTSGFEREPTEAELDALIAEQMRCLPAWWGESGAKFRQGDTEE